MKTVIFAAALCATVCFSAFAQQAVPPVEMLATLPTGTTVTNFYKQDVYDPSNTKIGTIDDVLVNQQGRITALLIGVGGFLGVGEKDVAVPFSSIRASAQDNKWHLVLGATKDGLKAAPGFTYDSTTTTWKPSKQ
jgi:sporulation protein YlmC with PRC-barrel domain